MNVNFLERSQVVMGLITAGIIAFGVFAALAIGGGFFRAGYEVTAEFADAGGLMEGDDVLIAGVRAGEVQSVELGDGTVTVTMHVDEHELPHNTRAEIILRTLVGRRSVDLQPTNDWNELLADGDVIPLERTAVPLDVPDFGRATEELLPEVDTEALDQLLVAVTDLARGQRDQVATLVAGGTQLTRIVNEQEQEVLELVRRLREVSEILASRDQEMASIIDDFGLVAGELVERRTDLQRFFRENARGAELAANLVEEKRGEIDGILNELHEVTTVLERNHLHLAEGLAYMGQSIDGFSEIAFAAGGVEVPWGDTVVTGLGAGGVEPIAACGGLYDQMLDQFFGPDPVPCHEQEGPAPREPGEPQGVHVPDLGIPQLPTPGSGAAAQDRGELDDVARRWLQGGDR
jgi:phospholipid/cholesterol/gamma-HCH transport system substrate-binding protein